MRSLLFLLVLLPAVSTHAQQPQQPTPPPDGSNWQRVLALPSGQSINVSARKSHAGCKLKSVDGDTLTCTHGKNLVFQHADILTITMPRHSRSALILGGIGAGIGVGAVAGASDAIGFAGAAKGTVYAGGAGIGAVLFGTIGFFTDLTRSTVYRAP
jgi:hypothetical protein